MNNFYDEMIPVEAREGSLGIEERIAQAAGPLLGWFEKNQRDLPWRRDPSPYHVWLSEIMLQQTRVEAVIPYYHRFLQALPGIPDLAAVEEEALMKLWQGLGYYNRARNLKKAAQVAVEQYDGRLPGSYEALLKMPGIGPYTAGAIGSIAYGLPVPAVDGNVLRVISRLIASDKDISSPQVKKEMEQWISRLLADMPELKPAVYNQALMELGALICIPNGVPHCIECPWEGICLAHRRNLTDQIPYKAPKKARKVEEKTVFLIRLEEAEKSDESIMKEEVGWLEAAEVCNQQTAEYVLEKATGRSVRYALRKRSPKGLLAGLYELPNQEGYLEAEAVPAAVEALLKERNLIAGVDYEIASVKALGRGKHIFTHVEWHMKGYEILLQPVQGAQSLLSALDGEQSLLTVSDEKQFSLTESAEKSADLGESALNFYSVDRIQQEIAIPNAFSTFVKPLFQNDGE